MPARSRMKFELKRALFVGVGILAVISGFSAYLQNFSNVGLGGVFGLPIGFALIIIGFRMSRSEESTEN